MYSQILENLTVAVQRFEIDKRLRETNTAFTNFFPKLPKGSGIKKFLDERGQSGSEDERYSAFYRFEFIENGSLPEWNPDRVIESAALIDTDTPLSRYFTVRTISLENEGVEILEIEDETQRWLAEMELRAATALSTELLDQWSNRINGTYTLNKPVQRVSGDFVFIQQVLKKGKWNPSALWAVGDCSGHGVHAAMLRLMVLNWLDELIFQEIKPNRKDLDRSRPKNIFDTRVCHPSQELLSDLYLRMDKLFQSDDHDTDFRTSGVRGFDGAILYLASNKQKGKLGANIWLSSAKFDIYRVRDFGKGNEKIQLLPRKARWRSDPNRSKGIMLGPGSDYYRTTRRFYASPDDLFIALSDGVPNALIRRKMYSKYRSEAKMVRTFVKDTLQQAKGKPSRFVSIAEKKLTDANGPTATDDVLVTVLHVGELMKSLENAK